MPADSLGAFVSLEDEDVTRPSAPPKEPPKPDPLISPPMKLQKRQNNTGHHTKKPAVAPATIAPSSITNTSAGKDVSINYQEPFPYVLLLQILFGLFLIISDWEVLCLIVLEIDLLRA